MPFVRALTFVCSLLLVLTSYSYSSRTLVVPLNRTEVRGRGTLSYSAHRTCTPRRADRHLGSDSKIPAATRVVAASSLLLTEITRHNLPGVACGRISGVESRIVSASHTSSRRDHDIEISETQGLSHTTAAFSSDFSEMCQVRTEVGQHVKPARTGEQLRIFKSLIRARRANGVGLSTRPRRYVLRLLAIGPLRSIAAPAAPRQWTEMDGFGSARPI